MVCVASENTSLKDKNITDVFQPVQSITPSPCIQRPNSGSNKSYISALINLQGAVQQIPPPPAAPDAAITAASTIEGQGETTARELASAFNRDTGEPKVDEKTRDILLDPLEKIARVLGRAGVAVINAGASGLCKDMSPMFAKYPFNPEESHRGHNPGGESVPEAG